jgi:hypothetical protein
MALIVANDLYDHEGLTHLLAPGADAEALAGVLGDAGIGNFAVQVVRNEPAHVIEGHIEEMFSESRPEDVLLLHFSCHGLKSESGELFFAARNTRPNRLGSTAVSADFVQRCMRASRSRSIVLLLDCCYGGAFSQGVKVRAAGDVNVLESFPGGRLGGGRGRAVITASSAMEYAFEGDQLADDHSRRPSVFTSALVHGLATGDADRDQDGWISLNELYDYVFDRVREQNPHQTPGRDVEMQGELYLARRSRPVTTAAPLPAELRTVIDHPLATIRAGAVQELARLHSGGHAGLALAARLALERLADDDSRTVAAAAASALLSADQEQGTAVPDVPPPVDAGPAAAPEVNVPPAGPPAPAVAHATDGPAAVPAQRPATDRGRYPSRRRIIQIAGAAAALAALAAVTVLLLDRGGTSPDQGRLGKDSFTATSPWRLVIRDAISGPDDGCDVTVTDTGGGEPVAIPTDVYGARSLQVHRTGSFRWTANNPGCQVSLWPGPGDAELPFVPELPGDTDAFDAPDTVVVRVVDLNGNPECTMALRDAADGRQVDVGSVWQAGGSVLLDPGDRAKVYVANPYCGISISAG